jgi:hypothetical protein
VELAPQPLKNPDLSNDFVCHMATRKGTKVYKIAPTKIEKRPINMFFLDFDGKYFPLRCILDLGSTFFVISPEAPTAFRIPVIKRSIPARAGYVRGRNIIMEGLFTIPFALSFGLHSTGDNNDHALEPVKTASEYDALIPAWYLQKHKV